MLQTLAPLQQRIDALAQTDLYDPARQRVLQLLYFEVAAKEAAQGAKLSSLPKQASHPLDLALGKGWKASVHRLEKALAEEELRVGLA